MSAKFYRNLIFSSVLILCCSGTFIRFWHNWDYYLSPDESLILSYSQKETVFDVWKESLKDPHPPLQFILLHFMLKISDSIVFLRLISLIPGVLSIAAFYFLGKEAFNRPTGVLLSYLISFNYGAILLSQVVRSYSLVLFFITISLTSYLAYVKGKNRRWSLRIFSISTCLAITSHYSAILLFLPILCTWLISIMVKKEHRKQQYRDFLAANSPIIIITAFLLASHYTLGNYIHSIYYGWLHRYYPRHFLDFYVAFKGLFSYFFTDINVIWASFFSIFGLLLMIKTKNKHLFMIICLTIALQCYLSVTKRYPLGPIRQSLYLLPLVALSISAFVNYLISSMAHLSGRDKESLIKFSTKPALVLTIFALHIVLTIFLTYHIYSLGFMRRYKGPSWAELPLKISDFNQISSQLKKNYSASDILLLSEESSWYAMFRGKNIVQEVDGKIGKIDFDGIEGYVIDVFSFEDVNEVAEIIHSMHGMNIIKNGTRIWMLNLGYGNLTSLLRQDPSLFSQTEELMQFDGNYIFNFIYTTDKKTDG